MNMDLVYPADALCPLDQGQLTEAILEERMDMESKEELTRVQLMNKVSNVVRREYNSMATKISRNVLTKLTAGPLGWKSSKGKECGGSPKHQASEDVRYEQRLAHMHTMKESQNEELDQLRHSKLVKTRVAERQMKTHANRLFNQRLFVKPSSKRPCRRKGGILVTSVEQGNEAAAVDKYIKQESHIFIENFFRNPSRNRRVLQRLNSTQLQRISAAELKNQAKKMARTEDQETSTCTNSIQTGEVKHNLSSKVKYGRSSIKQTAHRMWSPQRHTHPDTNNESSPVTKHRKIRKGGGVKGDYSKYHKKNLNQPKTEVLDGVQAQNDLVEKKKVKQRSNRGKVSDQLSNDSSTRLDSTTQVRSAEDEHIQPPYQVFALQESDAVTLPSTDLTDALSPTTPQYSCGPPCPTAPQYSGAPPYPTDFPLSDDDIETDGMSESKNEFEETLSSSCSDDDQPSQPEDEERLLLEGLVMEDCGDHSDIETDFQDSAHMVPPTKSGERQFVLDSSKTAKLSRRTSSHDSENESKSPHSRGSNFDRYYSSPQLPSDVFLSAENVHQDSPFYPPTHHTPHGYYSGAVVEVDPFAIAFQQGSVAAQDQISTDVTYSTQMSYQATTFNGSDTFEASFVSQGVVHTSASVSSPCPSLPVTPIELEGQVPARAFKDTKFLKFVDTLDHKPTKADYISYQLRMIGDQIDLKYDDKLNHALDAIFMDVYKNRISWETFSMISKKLLLEGQKLQDGIFLITCFGRRLAELTPQFGDTVTGFTNDVLDKYASNLIMNFGGWGQLVQSYNQVEASTEDYQFDYEDYNETGNYNGWAESDQLWYDEGTHFNTLANPRVLSLSPLHVISQTDSGSSVDLISTSPDAVIVNPPQTCMLNSNQEAVPDLRPPHRLCRAVSVEVLCSESDSPIEPAQSNHHSNVRDRVNRSISIDSIHTPLQPGIHCHGNVCSWKSQSRECEDVSLLGGSPPNLFQSTSGCQVVHMGSRHHSRHGSNVSVCSVSSIQVIKLQNGEEVPSPAADSGGHIGIVGSGEAAVTNGSGLSVASAPSGDYLDLPYDTPHQTVTNTTSSGNNGTNNGSTFMFPLATAAILTSAVALGFVFLRRFSG